MALAAPLPVFTILETIDAPSSTYYNFNDGTPTSLASGSLSASANASASASASASAGDALSLVLGPVYSSPPRTKLEVELEVEERTERAETISTNALTTSEPSVSPLTSPLASSPLELPNDVDDAALSESIGVAGPSTSRRFTYVGVRRGHKSGVYDNYPEAERQLIVSILQTHHDPQRLFGRYVNTIVDVRRPTRGASRGELMICYESRSTHSQSTRFFPLDSPPKPTSRVGTEPVDILYQ